MQKMETNNIPKLVVTFDTDGKTLEVDYRDEASYRYANLDYTVDGRAGMPQGYRRLLITQTVTLRNL